MKIHIFSILSYTKSMPEDATLQEYVNAKLVKGGPQARSLLSLSSQASPHERAVFNELAVRFEDYLGKKTDERLFLLPGLRGAGKTTLLAQMYSWLAAHGVESRRILYFNADEAWLLHGFSILNIIDAYERHLRTDLVGISRDSPCFLLIDEVQSDPKWDITLKVIFDQSRSLVVLATGFSAILLQGSAEVARRSHDIRIGPLTLAEYLWLKRGAGISQEIRDRACKALFWSPDAATAMARLEELRIRSLSTNGPYPHELEEYLVTGSLPRALALSRVDDVTE
jgi:predicted AAA+ superfamily ATPase